MGQTDVALRSPIEMAYHNGFAIGRPTREEIIARENTYSYEQWMNILSIDVLLHEVSFVYKCGVLYHLNAELLPRNPCSNNLAFLSEPDPPILYRLDPVRFTNTNDTDSNVARWLYRPNERYKVRMPATGVTICSGADIRKLSQKISRDWYALDTVLPTTHIKAAIMRAHESAIKNQHNNEQDVHRTAEAEVRRGPERPVTGILSKESPACKVKDTEGYLGHTGSVISVGKTITRIADSGRILSGGCDKAPGGSQRIQTGPTGITGLARFFI